MWPGNVALSHTSEKCSKVVILQDRKFILKNPKLHLDNVSRTVINVLLTVNRFEKKKKYNANEGVQTFFIEQIFFNTVIFPKKNFTRYWNKCFCPTHVSRKERNFCIIFIQMVQIYKKTQVENGFKWRIVATKWNGRKFNCVKIKKNNIFFYRVSPK
jgi:hypothetical protein